MRNLVFILFTLLFNSELYCQELYAISPINYPELSFELLEDGARFYGDFDLKITKGKEIKEIKVQLFEW